MTHRRSLSIHTFGCKLNQCESAHMQRLLSRDFDVTIGRSAGDIFLFNSCTVTAEAERKLRQRFRSLKRKNPDSLFLVTGCYSELSETELRRLGFDEVIKSDHKTRMDSVIKQVINGDRKAYCLENGFPLSLSAPEGRTRAYLTIQDGCSNRCTYCRVRLARGSSIRSKPVSLVKSEFQNLVDRGFKEIVLTGLNICFFGSGLGSSLLELLQELSTVKGEWRLRLSSLHPAFVKHELVEFIALNPRIAQHLHLSLQSGSNRILSLMNRGYDRESFMSLVDVLRGLNPLIAMTTDVIVGFPSETEADFDETCEVVKEVEFLKTHIFRFSARPGTAAASFAEQVPTTMKKERAERLERLSRESARDYLEKSLGQNRVVLVERATHTASSGRDEYYVPHIASSGEEGELVEVVSEKICSEEVESYGLFHFRSLVVH